MPIDRRDFLIGSASAATGLCASSVATARGEPAASTPKSGARLSNPIAVSTYSFWRYRAARMTIEDCIDSAAQMGFDAVEILEKQMHRIDDAYLQSLKRRAFVAGLSLCGMSTHQDFVSPKARIARRT